MKQNFFKKKTEIIITYEKNIFLKQDKLCSSIPGPLNMRG
jgi:hypothetical protein